MIADPIVSNTSPLIALNGIGQLELLAQLYTRVWVPPAVMRELLSVAVVPGWLMVQAITRPLDPLVIQARLGAGETEAISLALEVGAQQLIIDDLDGRRLAAALGLPIMGTLGVLLAAKQRGLLLAVRPHVDALVQFEFHMGSALYRRVLVEAGEFDGTNNSLA